MDSWPLDRDARRVATVEAARWEVVGTVEFFQPRIEEVYGLLPPRLVQWIKGRALLRGLPARRFGKGQRLRPHTVSGQLMLQALTAMRRWRRSSLRHRTEMANIEQWWQQVKALMAHDCLLALELLSCRRLVKAYSATHARGSSKFGQLLRAAALADAQSQQRRDRWTVLGAPQWASEEATTAVR